MQQLDDSQDVLGPDGEVAGLPMSPDIELGPNHLRKRSTKKKVRPAHTPFESVQNEMKGTNGKNLVVDYDITDEKFGTYNKKFSDSGIDSDQNDLAVRTF